MNKKPRLVRANLEVGYLKKCFCVLVYIRRTTEKNDGQTVSIKVFVNFSGSFLALF